MFTLCDAAFKNAIQPQCQRLFILIAPQMLLYTLCDSKCLLSLRQHYRVLLDVARLCAYVPLAFLLILWRVWGKSECFSEYYLNCLFDTRNSFAYFLPRPWIWTLMSMRQQKACIFSFIGSMAIAILCVFSRRKKVHQIGWCGNKSSD